MRCGALVLLLLRATGPALALPLSQLMARLRASRAYRSAFKRAYGRESISRTTIGRALASYVRTLRSGDAAADRYAAGDSLALSAEAQRGRSLFYGKANCSVCHVGPNFTDEHFHNTGVAWGGPDAGRFAVTHDSADRGRFKVPTLRNVERTAPYMHDGSIATLADVVDFYDRGGRANPRLDPELRPLALGAEEKRDLVAFLRSLTGSRWQAGRQSGSRSRWTGCNTSASVRTASGSPSPRDATETKCGSWKTSCRRQRSERGPSSGDPGAWVGVQR